MIETALISFVVTVISGVALLIVEHRTNWFANRISSLTKKDLLEPIETNKLENSLSRAKWIFGTLIFSIPTTALVMALLFNYTVANLEQQVKIYEQYSDWNLPETLTALHDISQELNLTIQDRKKVSEYDVMKEQFSSLQDENEQLKKQLSNFVFQSNNIKVAVGETVTLIDGYYFLGVKNVLSSSVSINISGRDYLLDLADDAWVYNTDMNIDCKLFLTKINSDETVEFKFICY